VKSEIPFKMKNLGHFSAEGGRHNPSVPLFEREIRSKKVRVPQEMKPNV